MSARRFDRTAMLFVVVVALTAALRLVVDLRSGGLHGARSSDDGVYYSAAASLVAGRVPYRDFLFLHPPGVMLALAPFAAVGRAIGDPTGFAAARLACILLGAVNAGLVTLVLRRFGPVAAVAGAIVYAASWPVVFAERSALLEPIGCAFLLAAFALAADPDRRPGSRRTVLIGGLLAAAILVKLVFAVPAVVLLIALRRRAPLALLAAAIATAAVCLPFLLAAPAEMPQQLLADQLGRRRIVPLIGLRLAAITMPPVVPGVPQRTVLAVVLVLAAAVVVTGLLTRGARRFAVLAIVELGLLLAGPSFYGHYAVLVLLPLSVLTGVAIGRLGQGGRALARRRSPVRTIATVLAVAAVVAVVGGAWTPGRVAVLSTPAAPEALIRAVHTTSGCVTSDLTTTLIMTDVLSRDLARRCSVWPDVTGWQYDPRGNDGRVPRPWPADDAVYQRLLLRHLSGGAVVALTWRKDGLSDATRAALLTGRILYRGPAGVVARSG